jgi:hypothetical protein
MNAKSDRHRKPRIKKPTRCDLRYRAMCSRSTLLCGDGGKRVMPPGYTGLGKRSVGLGHTRLVVHRHATPFSLPSLPEADENDRALPGAFGSGFKS